MYYFYFSTMHFIVINLLCNELMHLKIKKIDLNISLEYLSIWSDG